MNHNNLYEDPVDQSLLERLAKGDHAAMRVLFRSFYSRLSFLATELLGNNNQAEDMAQEALSVFWEKRASFAHSSMNEVSAYLFTTVRNRCFNALKHARVKDVHHQKITQRLSEYDSLAEAKIIKEDLYYKIYLEIQALPDNQRQLLKMIFVEGLETDEIAGKLGITPNNVRNQKARALEKLRTLLLKKRLSAVFIYFLALLVMRRYPQLFSM